MNIREYLSNPLGKGSAVMQIKHMADLYNKRYENNRQNISHKIYLVRDTLYFHIKIPSSIDIIHYDVVIKFMPTKVSTDVTILDMDFQVFSNCPSFIYTYANTYNRKGMVIPEIKRKLTKEAIKKSAKVRNPYDIIGYEYSIYLAFKYIMDKRLFSIIDMQQRAIKSKTVMDLYSKIQDFDSLMKKRSLREKVLRERNKQESKVKKKKYKSQTSDNDEKKESVSPSKEIGKIKTSKNINRSKRIKSTPKR